MDQRPFFFKRFAMFHHRSTMRVGTDSVLFARWVEVLSTDKSLDIGTGCGIIPLIMSQRGVGSVDAVDMDYESTREADLNFKLSLWKDRLCVFNDDVRNFALKNEKKYDLIVSNPPFYSSDVKPIREKKVMARHVSTLSFKDLLVSVKKMLKDDGRFALVLPYVESRIFIKEAETLGFYLHRNQYVVPINGKEPNRVNMQFRLYETDAVDSNTIVIRNSDYSYSDEYKSFLEDYYLHF